MPLATEGWSGALATLGSSVTNTASDWWTVARQQADRLGESLPPPVRARWSLFLAGTRHFGGWVSETWKNGGPHLSGDSKDYKKILAESYAALKVQQVCAGRVRERLNAYMRVVNDLDLKSWPAKSSQLDVVHGLRFPFVTSRAFFTGKSRQPARVSCGVE